jgi:hypothetical protein
MKRTEGETKTRSRTEIEDGGKDQDQDQDLRHCALPGMVFQATGFSFFLSLTFTALMTW